MYTDYKVGDKAWIHGVDEDTTKNRLCEGTIVHEFSLPDHYLGNKYYVIEIPTHIDPLLEVRNAWSMSPNADTPIGLFAAVREGVA